MVKVPADSWTTCPAGQASMAAWMAEVASPPGGLTVRHTVVRAGMPPATPGFQTVIRSAGRSPAMGGGGCEGAAVRVPVAAALGVVSARLVGVTWKVPAGEGAA